MNLPTARYILNERRQTLLWGAALGRRLRAGDLVALSGDLGAGKTTLTQAIARGMGIAEHVTSPTFALIQMYEAALPLIHVDPYRLDRPEDLLDVGIEEYFDSACVVVVEWAEMLAEWLPEDRLEIRLTMEEEPAGDDAEAPRSALVTATGVRASELLAEAAEDPAWRACLADKNGA